MKRFITILSLLLFTTLSVAGQEDDNDTQSDKIKEKMSEFIQRRMGLTKAEAEKFNPIFFRYFKEWKATLRDNKNDKPMLQLRIAELRIRYRAEFKDIVGEKRCNQIYEHQEIFIKEIRRLRQEQMDRRPLRRNRALLQ